MKEDSGPTQSDNCGGASRPSPLRTPGGDPAHPELVAYLHRDSLALQLVLPDLNRKTATSILHVLRGIDPGVSPEGALAAAVKYRLDSLDATLRRRFGVIGLFRGFVSARILAALSLMKETPDLLRELRREDWIRLLDAAAAFGLLEKEGEGGYLIPPALQLPFQTLLQEGFAAELGQLERAFCAVCGRASNQLAQIARNNREFAEALLFREQHNLRRALDLTRQNQDWRVLSEILSGLRIGVVAQGGWTEWSDLVGRLETELQCSQPTPPPDLESLYSRLRDFRAEIKGHGGDG